MIRILFSILFLFVCSTGFAKETFGLPELSPVTNVSTDSKTFGLGDYFKAYYAEEVPVSAPVVVEPEKLSDPVEPFVEQVYEEKSQDQPSNVICENGVCRIVQGAARVVSTPVQVVENSLEVLREFPQQRSILVYNTDQTVSEYREVRRPVRQVGQRAFTVIRNVASTPRRFLSRFRR